MNIKQNKHKTFSVQILKKSIEQKLNSVEKELENLLNEERESKNKQTQLEMKLLTFKHEKASTENEQHKQVKKRNE